MFADNQFNSISDFLMFYQIFFSPQAAKQLKTEIWY